MNVIISNKKTHILVLFTHRTSGKQGKCLFQINYSPDLFVRCLILNSSHDLSNSIINLLMKILNRVPQLSSFFSKNLYAFSETQAPINQVVPGLYKLKKLKTSIILKDDSLTTALGTRQPTVVKIQEYVIKGVKTYKIQALQKEGNDNWVVATDEGNTLGKQLYATAFDIRSQGGEYVLTTLTFDQQPLRFLGTGSIAPSLGKQVKLVQNIETFELVSA